MKQKEQVFYITFELACALTNDDVFSYLEESGLTEPEKERVEAFIEQADYFLLSPQASDAGFDVTDGRCDATGLWSDSLIEVIGIIEEAS